MGIESDQLVYDYLSRVGDLAQQQQLSSGVRMRLVSTLRVEIERQRGAAGADSPTVVRRIIGRLGDPDELVAAAARSADGTVSLPAPRTAAEPEAKSPPAVPRPRRGLLRKDTSRKGASAPAPPAPAEGSEEPDDPVPGWPSPQAPHMSGLDGAPSAPGAGAEWWRVEPGPLGDGVSVPGFFGGVEIPEMLRPPPVEHPDEAREETEEAAEEPAPRPRRRPRLRRRRKLVERTADVPADTAGTAHTARLRLTHPLLLLAAALLVAGAVMGSWLALAGGWLLAYSSRRLSRAEAKWAVMGLPGLVVAGALVWLWGRLEGRWGAPIPESGMGEALTATWPVVLRTAAVASALYLVWRSRRAA
ncbi:hypothetical protein [Streptomyces fulvorobeus]|uniref:Membrane protein n=1 Tax=Streptomyces fulvorobeus TaxID=284028 RepID=A0A7J0C820_9ACTN|nr:hypothetical protein [Streptomyces fulvorobeus]NYE42228.1 hypothetical protein [Streptomyces fulvorobeus]GFM98609.1 membrane protein [Streptomyces fulvorobeus]